MCWRCIQTATNRRGCYACLFTVLDVNDRSASSCAPARRLRGLQIAWRSESDLPSGRGVEEIEVILFVLRPSSIFTVGV